MSTTAETAKMESKKPARKKAPGKPHKKAAPRRPKKSDDEGPMPGKKLLQSWVDEEVHEHFSKMAESAHLRPATYLRQLVHAHVDADRAARKEMGNGAGS